MELVDTLPAHLAERTRRVGAHRPPAAGVVLYWMRAALRVDENPALDVALTLAEALGRDLLVYQGLDERTPQATDRVHRFILQSAAEVHAALAERGIPSALHVARHGHRGPHLRTLAEGAALVVTEEFPLAPLAEWTEALAGRAAGPVLAVDTACVVPMGSDGPPGAIAPPDRAFRFRKRHATTRSARLVRRWPVLLPWRRRRLDQLDLALPFAPVDLTPLVDDPRSLDRRIAALTALQEIDHGVPPVPAPRGGTRAGVARWTAFRDAGLSRYHKTRNDPLRDGTSRISPWLHFGMISPFRVAREAFEAGGPGADKFLDELLVWRELAWHMCFHDPRAGTWEGLPEWSRKTLQAHARDPRRSRLGWEALARGQSGHPLWDAAQRSLLLRGELHNNLRMTWAKGAIPWVDDPRDAFRILLDLNDRFALDGRDPASVGGVGWAFGLFDRPFPESPVLGTVRGRSLDRAAERTDPERLARRVGTGLRSSMPTVAVIGAGVAGLACARTLRDHGCRVTVFDKARGPGGRTATRRRDGDAGALAFDHGAPFFTVDDPRFGRFARSWVAEGRAARWRPREAQWADGEVTAAAAPGATRLVATPRMSTLCRHLSADLDLRTGVRVGTVTRADGFRLADEAGGALGRFDRVVVAVPAPQAVPLLAAAPALADAAGSVDMAPRLTLMLALASPSTVGWDLLDLVDHPVLSQLHRVSSKPDRAPAPECWVAHASPAWSRDHLDQDLSELAAPLLAAVRTLLPEADAAVHHRAHRWRYGLPAVTGVDPRGHLFDPDLGLGACGDWCPGTGRADRAGAGGVQAAWLSGISLAGALLGAEVDRPPPGQATLF